MYIMITEELKTRRIANAKKAYNNSETDWSKTYWFNVMQKLCKMYKRVNILAN